MNNENRTNVTCDQCGRERLEEDGRQTTSGPCPICGSVTGSIAVSLSEPLPPFHVSLAGKVNDPARSRKENPRVHFFIGEEERRADGKWMKKERTIDRDRNRYTETVTDPDTGEVVHKCDEELKKHIGHGSAIRKETMSNKQLKVIPGNGPRLC